MSKRTNSNVSSSTTTESTAIISNHHHHHQNKNQKQKRQQKIQNCLKYGAHSLANHKLESALVLFDKAMLFLSNQNNYEPNPNERGALLEQIGDLFSNENRKTDALLYYQRALKPSLQKALDPTYEHAFFSSADSNSSSNIHSKTNALYSQKLKSQSYEALVLTNGALIRRLLKKVAHLFFEMHDYENALIIYTTFFNHTKEPTLKSILILAIHGGGGENDHDINLHEWVQLWYRMGLLCVYKKSFDAAQEYIWRALKLCRAIHNGAADNYATYCKQDTIDVVSSLDTSYQIVNLLYCMGMIHAEKFELEWAVFYFLETVSIHRHQYLKLLTLRTQQHDYLNSTTFPPQFKLFQMDMIAATRARLSLTYIQLGRENDSKDVLKLLQQLILEICEHDDNQTKGKSKSSVTSNSISASTNKANSSVDTNMSKNYSSGEDRDNISSDVQKSENNEDTSVDHHEEVPLSQCMVMWKEAKGVMNKME